jgi:hypothetical protein
MAGGISGSEAQRIGLAGRDITTGHPPAASPAPVLGQPEDVFAPIYARDPNLLIELIRYPGREATQDDQGVGPHQADLRHDCWDIGPACVPGTVWDTASSQTAKFRSRRCACLLIPASSQPAGRCRVSRQRCSPAGSGVDQRDARHSSNFRSSGRKRHFRPSDRSPPDQRGFGPPSTGDQHVKR